VSRKGCSSGLGGEYDISSLEGMVIGISDGNGGSKVVSADFEFTERR
jgi:hypothetical protein